ncbi:hypothetical protein F2P81_013520 [Scophthalmus maximus]|uniref:Uncharacterized protein n=1 Tax=Scophthalmus maximus TaxID=52904 RepID=A0A6A4SR00_SCOMX|nr:hypothetical protein F2P81_013520 [Scophthalmus maximus]
MLITSITQSRVVVTTVGNTALIATRRRTIVKGAASCEHTDKEHNTESTFTIQSSRQLAEDSEVGVEEENTKRSLIFQFYFQAYQKWAANIQSIKSEKTRLTFPTMPQNCTYVVFLSSRHGNEYGGHDDAMTFAAQMSCDQ